MARYLVIHTPIEDEEERVRPPSALEEFARACGDDDSSPRWLRTWSPDLHDDRIFTLWEARNADEIGGVLKQFGFLDHMTFQALRVQEWGPAEVLAIDPDE